MLGNLLRPWLLARFVTSGAAAVLAAYVLVMALRLVQAQALAQSAEGRGVIDRRAELLASLTRVQSGLSILSLVLAVVGADRLHDTMRGAMCAWGVLAATPWGFRSLFVAFGAALAGTAWLALHGVESRLPTPVLTREKLMGAVAMAPLCIADVVLSTMHALALDFREVASCCASGLESAREVLGETGGPRLVFVALFFAAGLGAAVSAAMNARRGRSSLSAVTTVFTVIGALAAPLAITTWVAPHAYGTPNHLCPFCLLHADEGLGLGYPLYVALWIAIARGVSVGITAWVDRRRGPAPPDPDLTAALTRTSAGAAVAWMVTLLLSAAPWAWHTATTGTSLFG